MLTRWSAGPPLPHWAPRVDLRAGLGSRGARVGPCDGGCHGVLHRRRPSPWKFHLPTLLPGAGCIGTCCSRHSPRPTSSSAIDRTAVTLWSTSLAATPVGWTTHHPHGLDRHVLSGESESTSTTPPGRLLVPLLNLESARSGLLGGRLPPPGCLVCGRGQLPLMVPLKVELLATTSSAASSSQSPRSSCTPRGTGPPLGGLAAGLTAGVKLSGYCRPFW